MKVLLLPLLCFTGIIAFASASGSTYIFPPTPAPGLSNVSFTASSAFDGPRASSFNSSTFQWWYFDAVSSDLSSSLVIVFFVNSQSPAPAPFNTVSLNALLPNGTLLAAGAAGGSMVVRTEGEGSSGVLNGTGWSWEGKRDMSEYTITIDDPVSDIKGKVYFKSVSPFLLLLRLVLTTITPGRSSPHALLSCLSRREPPLRPPPRLAERRPGRLRLLRPPHLRYPPHRLRKRVPRLELRRSPPHRRSGDMVLGSCAGRAVCAGVV